MSTQVGRLSLDVVINAPPQVVWDEVTNWSGQSDWMLATRVQPVQSDNDGSRPVDGRGLGGELEAWTGFGRLAIRDEMTVTTWQPPQLVIVEHTGKMVQGLGIFEVFALPENRSRFVWTEELGLPLGPAGRLGWFCVRPLVAVGLRRSLNLLRDSIEATNP